MNFWHGKRVLLTGHTGFKGSWLGLWLSRLGAEVTGISLSPVTQPNLFTLLSSDAFLDSRILDVRDASSVAKIVKSCSPEIVFHLAAQPLVRDSYQDPINTYSTNVQGTVNVLDACREVESCRVIVVVTTDKVYHNPGDSFPFRETDALGGHDPYSASKAACEIVVSSYREAFLKNRGIAVASARAGNVIGGGDWSRDRLIPDAVRAWEGSGSLHVRNPQSIRPWQHVLDPLWGYLELARSLWDCPQLPDSYNFGPNPHEAATVREVIEQACLAFPSGTTVWGEVDQGPHEASWLALDNTRARTRLGVKPRWTLEKCLSQTMSWYRKYYEGESAGSLCENDIDAFELTEI
ncbi:CDP-glucose 4,6-dehydratase [Halomonas pacifica]|uniref:CDP-glucose 4,6-dehydratase n=1 Tax=Bisbaumannia pacifica TaxID=77098 RepID=UPI0023581F82|nr:CDP-glucose 4,6-dehydratase [Halomonas pacifica]MDC8803470.1 CDP-glucose 4,6-dehydratase [Halomonas pacifica]